MTATSVTNAAGQLILDGMYGPKLVTDGFGPPAGSRWAGRGAALVLDPYGGTAGLQVDPCPQGDNFFVTLSQVPAFVARVSTLVLAVYAGPASAPAVVCYARASPDGSTPAGYSVTWIVTAAQTGLLTPGNWYARATVGTPAGDRLTTDDLWLCVRPEMPPVISTLARGVPGVVTINNYNLDGSLYDLTGMLLTWTTWGAGTFTKQQVLGELVPVGPGTVQIPLTATETGSLAPNTLLYGRMADAVSALSWATAPVQVGP
jgi:hypothetical protein